MKNKPNFFLIGAARCGSTALYSYLYTHPNIFLPEHKEPHYFTDYYPEKMRLFRDLDSYLALFANVKSKHKIIGEASTTYLPSKIALQRIREFQPTAKIMCVLRNPIDTVQSRHSYSYYQMMENEEDFIQAWRLQESRERGENIPRLCLEPRFLQYGTGAKFGEQIKNLLKVFPEEQVHIIFFEDLIGKPKETYARALKFLELEDDGRVDFQQMNESRDVKSKFVARLIRKTCITLNPMYRMITKTFHLKPTGIVSLFQRLNSKTRFKSPITPEFHNELVDYFHNDVKQLAKITDRNLDHWLKKRAVMNAVAG